MIGLLESEISGSFPDILALTLDLLEVLPGVVDDVDVSRSARLLLNKQLIDFSVHLYDILEKLIVSRQETFQEHEVTSLLRLVRAWGSSCGLTLSGIADKYHSLFVFILMCVRSSTNATCLAEACLTLHSILSVNEYPRPSQRNAAVAMVMQALAGQSADAQTPSVGAFDNPSLHYLLSNTGMCRLRCCSLDNKLI